MILNAFSRVEWRSGKVSAYATASESFSFPILTHGASAFPSTVTVTFVPDVPHPGWDSKPPGWGGDDIVIREAPELYRV